MNKIRLFAALLCALAFVACSSETSMPEPSMGRVRISMAANVSNVIARSDVSSFPNADGGAAQVAVIARKSSGSNWSSMYINHAIANVGSADAGYSLDWAEGHDQFWPSNGDELTFAAYSPISAGGSGTSLNVELKEDKTPDVVVALTKDGTNPITGSKSGSGQTPSNINFVFEHVLSQLQIKIKNLSSDITVQIVDVTVEKNHCVKAYDILGRTWTDGSAPAEDMKHRYYKITGLGNGGVLETLNETFNQKPLLLFPGTQSSVTITVRDASDNVLASKKVNEFLDTGNVAASLVAGKKTTLIITVKDKELFGMTAGVNEWEDLGNFEVIL